MSGSGSYGGSSSLKLNSSLNSFYTAHYQRKLDVFKNRPSESNPNEYIAESSSNASNIDDSAFILGGGSGKNAQTVASGTYISDNTKSGITFLAFNRAQTVNKVNLDVSGDNGSGSTQDFGDSIFYDTDRAKSTNSTSSSAQTTFIGSSITTGTANSLTTNDKDLVFFGSDYSTTSTDTSPKFYEAGWTGKSVKIQNVLAPSSSQAALIVQGSAVNTGNDDDTLVFANTNSNTKIGGTGSGEGNIFSMGQGKDYVYFAAPDTIYAQNVIDLGSDTDADTLTLNGNTLKNLNGTTQWLTVKNFVNNTDKLVFNNTVYNTQSAIQGVSAIGQRIRFS